MKGGDLVNDSGLNKFDWIAAGLALVGIFLGIGGTIANHKANQVRNEQYAAQMAKMNTLPPPQKTEV